VLVACEASGVVREAFRARGHNAWSCDLRPAEDASPFHMERDIFNVLQDQWWDRWDLLIAHPPCTYLSSSGLHWNARRPGRSVLTNDAVNFCRRLLDADVERIALENPIGRLSTAIRKPDQIIQPWQFGHPESKATCLWLKGLPKLQPTRICVKAPGDRWANQTPSGQNKLGPSPDRWRLRAKTYSGIAKAMADQWGGA
jgi:hypothetical protein